MKDTVSILTLAIVKAHCTNMVPTSLFVVQQYVISCSKHTPMDTSASNDVALKGLYPQSYFLGCYKSAYECIYYLLKQPA